MTTPPAPESPDDDLPARGYRGNHGRDEAVAAWGAAQPDPWTSRSDPLTGPLPEAAPPPAAEPPAPESAIAEPPASEPLATSSVEQPFRAVRSDVVPPSGPVPVIAEPAPTPRPPQPAPAEPEVARYGENLAQAPTPGAAATAGPATAGPAPVAPAPGPTGAWGVGPVGAAPSPAAAPPAAPASSSVPPPPTSSPTTPPGGFGAPTAALPRPEDLLVSSTPRSLRKPATWGFRGRLNRLSGGMLSLAPGAAELTYRRTELTAQRGFSRPMTVVVIQPKGGAGKTPTTICLASALGVRRGGYVVGWDNNETRGTLAVRTGNADEQQTTAWDLLGRLDEFERPDARVGDLAFFVRSQGAAQFDALVSDDNPGNMAQIGEVEFRRIHSVLQRFYRMIIVDTGNNVRSPNWQAAVDYADQVVVVSTYQRDVAYSGSWVLDHLAQTGRDRLARNAITVLTAAEPSVDAKVRTDLVEHFGKRTRAVVEVPYDPAIAAGGPIRWDELHAASQRAWTSAAAAVTTSLAEQDVAAATARR